MSSLKHTYPIPASRIYDAYAEHVGIDEGYMHARLGQSLLQQRRVQCVFTDVNQSVRTVEVFESNWLALMMSQGSPRGKAGCKTFRKSQGKLDPSKKQ
jgi:hypothetical protein